MSFFCFRLLYDIVGSWWFQMHHRRICVLRGRQGNVEFPDWFWSTAWKMHGVEGKILMKCWLEVFPFNTIPFLRFLNSKFHGPSVCAPRAVGFRVQAEHTLGKNRLRTCRKEEWTFETRRIVCVDVRVMKQLLSWSAGKIIHLCSMIDCFLQSSLGRSSSNLLTCHLSFQKAFLYFRWEEGQTRKSLAVCLENKPGYLIFSKQRKSQSNEQLCLLPPYRRHCRHSNLKLALQDVSGFRAFSRALTAVFWQENGITQQFSALPVPGLESYVRWTNNRPHWIVLSVRRPEKSSARLAWQAHSDQHPNVKSFSAAQWWSISWVQDKLEA